MTAGVGIEVKLDEDWFMGGEYLYTDFGTKTANYGGDCGVYPVCQVHNKRSTQTMRLTLNYRL